MNKFYVYAHYKPNETVPFYVGKGTGNRMHSKKSRSSYWQNIVNKYGLEIKVIRDKLTEQEAIELERCLIAEYGRLDTATGCLINRTDGGEGGSSGRICSDETREKIRKSKIGKKRSREVCQRLSEIHKGKLISDDMKQRISKANSGKTPWNKGNPAWNKGKPMSEETKKKLSESRKALFKDKK
jgi:hypothetical protein